MPDKKLSLYHLFIFPVQQEVNQDIFRQVYRGSFDTLKEVMDFRFTPYEQTNADMRNFRAGLYMTLEDGTLSLIRFGYCSKVSPWGSWYDVDPHPNYGYSTEDRSD